MKSSLFPAGSLAVLCLAFGGCNYDFPLTAKPTQKIDSRLTGDWVAADRENKNEELLQVRQQDDSTYLVAMDDSNYRVFHSDFANTAFLSVQEMSSTKRQYVYVTWKLSANGKQLTLQTVSTKVVPESTKSAADAQRLIKENLKNPALLGEPLVFNRKPDPAF